MIQERKEAILRKNMERNNKVDGRTHKNASTFVFGSSTPRTMNQELPSLESIASGSSRYTNPTSLNSVPPVLYRNRQNQNDPVNMNSPSGDRPFIRRARPMSAYACLSAVDHRVCKLTTNFSRNQLPERLECEHSMNAFHWKVSRLQT